MKPFAIKFGDNDFTNTFVPLLTAIKNSDFDGTKDDLIELINMSALSFYCMYQRRGMLGLSERDSMAHYLTVTSKEVYYGDEVDEAFKSQDFLCRCNSDCYFYYPGNPTIGIM